MSESNIYQLLVNSHEKDDESLFKSIYLEYYPRLIVFSKGYIKQREICEDIVEDILMKLWDNRGSLTHIKNLKFYLYVSAKNACLNYLASKNRILSQSIECSFDFDLGPITVSPEDTLISEERIELIQTAIQSLPPKCKAIFILIKEDELKYAEVAELLNISIKTIEAQMTIALKKLSLAFEFEFPELVSRTYKKKSI
ncbi:RNA polymerase sigma-70 factor [Daejeonella sp.]|uniref:RNA polymerase sigma-70 factor n=1 Tax=Daejeonella sp. TaxID=2805397 RepID=UPI0030BE690B